MTKSSRNTDQVVSLMWNKIGSDGCDLNMVACISFIQRRRKLVKVLRKMYRPQKADIVPIQRSERSQ